MCPNVFDNREYSFFVNNVTDTTFLDEFSCHRGEYVVVGVHRMKAPLSRELALHHERHQHFPTHQPQAGPLRRSVVDQELRPSRKPLADAPQKAAKGAGTFQCPLERPISNEIG
jgi:hypothetical protein